MLVKLQALAEQLPKPPTLTRATTNINSVYLFLDSEP